VPGKSNIFYIFFRRTVLKLIYRTERAPAYVTYHPLICVLIIVGCGLKTNKGSWRTRDCIMWARHVNWTINFMQSTCSEDGNSFKWFIIKKRLLKWVGSGFANTTQQNSNSNQQNASFMPVYVALPNQTMASGYLRWPVILLIGY